MEKEVIGAIVGAVGGLITGVVGALATLRAKGVDRLIEERKLWVGSYDIKLLEQRLVEYKKLWKWTESTSRRYVRALDFLKARSLAEDLTSWYYTDGGIVLSEDARNAFFSARDILESPERETLGDKWHSQIVSRFSELRTALCEDMNSRRGPTLRSGQDDRDRAESVRQEARAL